jgi:catechol 2,3-dioxygenase-like lactoylglutathione lyase family enzyme
VRVNKQLTLLFELDDGKLNDWGGGRGFYFRDPNGHVLELMTVPQ